LYLIYMSTGAYDIARSYVDRYIVIWNFAVIIGINLCYCISVVMPVYLCTVSLQHSNTVYEGMIFFMVELIFSVCGTCKFVRYISNMECSILMMCDSTGSLKTMAIVLSIRAFMGGEMWRCDLL
jgi:hypothetical protein